MEAEKKNNILCWTPQMEKAFPTIKTAFSTKPVLAFSDLTSGKPFIFDSDWCKEGIAQGISQDQEGPDGIRERVIAYGEGNVLKQKEIIVLTKGKQQHSMMDYTGLNTFLDLPILNPG